MHIKVRVKTEAKKEEVVQKTKDRYEISLKEKPERNEANKKLVQVVGKHFAIPINKIKIVSGHKKPSKVVLIDDGDSK